MINKHSQLNRGTIIENVNREMKRKGTAPKEIYGTIGMAPSSWYNCMNLNAKRKRNFTLEQIYSVAECLECSVNDLICEEHTLRVPEIRDICKFIVDMLEGAYGDSYRGFAIGRVTVKEDCFIEEVDRDGYANGMTLVRKDNIYPAFYFSNYDKVVDDYDYEMFSEVGNEIGGSYTINNFVKQYLFIRNAHKNASDTLDQQMYDDLVQKLINNVQ